MDNPQNKGPTAALLNALLSTPRLIKLFIVVSADAVMLFLATWFALYLRLGDTASPLGSYGALCFIVPMVGVTVLAAFGSYRSVLRYFCVDDAWVIAKAISVSVLMWATVSVMLQLSLPRSLILMQWFLAIPLLIGVRLTARQILRELSPYGIGARRKNDRNVLIYGADSAGVQLVQGLANTAEMRAIAFVDDNPALQGRRLAGLWVYSVDALAALIEAQNIDDVLLAMSAISPAEKKSLLQKLSLYPVRVRIIPSLAELTDGRVGPGDIRDIKIEDLLGRIEVSPNESLLGRDINNKVVMVTGAGGSIGSELCRQILRQRPRAIILFELSEYNLYSIERELTGITVGDYEVVRIIAIMGSVQDLDHLLQVMKSYAVNTVYHAAAYKHVPLVEHNIVSSLRNNVFGTLTAARACLACGVENFVLISTDKAVRPTNVMGASKRFAEMVLQGLADLDSSAATRFTIVRFGNVLGSSGSVIPLFKEQIEKGGPVTITHPDVTRYFMTVTEAASLVLQAGSMGRSGDVFVLDMGEPVRIVDLAEQMIQLAGNSRFNESDGSGDIEIVFTGLRPGEKLFEELLVGDSATNTGHPMIRGASERQLSWHEVNDELLRMEILLRNGDVEKLRELLMRSVTDYLPQGDIVDLLVRDSDVQHTSIKSSELQSKIVEA
jgi:FlaA1/EpsC-like NDP-sugar epimerase